MFSCWLAKVNRVWTTMSCLCSMHLQAAVLRHQQNILQQIWKLKPWTVIYKRHFSFGQETISIPTHFNRIVLSVGALFAKIITLKTVYNIKTHGEEMRIILLKGGHVLNCPAANGLKGLFHSDNCIYDRRTHFQTHMNQYACEHVCQRAPTRTSSQTHRPFKAVKCSLIRVAGRHPE